MLEPSATFTRENAALARTRSEVKPLLDGLWNGQFEKWPQRLKDAAEFITARPTIPEKERPALEQLPVEPWKRAFALAAWAKKDVMMSAFLPLTKVADEPAFVKAWGEASRSALEGVRDRPATATVYADFRDGLPTGWRVSGAGLPPTSQEAGEVVIATTGEQAIRAVRPAGYFSDTLSDRHGGMLRSPDFTIDVDCISVLAGGHNGARARLVIENFQGDSTLFAGINPNLEASNLQWYTWKMRDQWRGRRAYIELFTRDDRPYVEIGPIREKFELTDGRSGFGIVEVLFHPAEWKPRLAVLPDSFWSGEARSWEEVAQRLVVAGREALHAWQAAEASERQLTLMCELTAFGLLESRFDRTAADLAERVERYRFIEGRIPVATRVPGLRDDGDGLDSELFPRGNHLKPAAAVPRRFLQVLGSTATSYTHQGSGRLALADEVTNRDNPLTARVIVNRVWVWLFAQGLVLSADNFGKLGAVPTHPELLDFLTAQFVSDGWSVKRLIRRILLSRTWQLSSHPSEMALEKDPQNQWLQHFSVRRLDAEEIRDSLLSVAGNLSPEIGGMSVRNFYRVSVDTSQPPSGPIDGNGRRSLYLEMRRNCRNEFLQVFDQPKPVVTTGERPRSNVPAQSLAMLNDPFLIFQARVWAERIVREITGDRERLERLFEEAFNRPARKDDLDRLKPLVPADSSSVEGWSAVTHVLFNHKEFLYIP